MSIQLLNPNRPLFGSGDDLGPTPEELKEAFDGYFDYFGSYTVDEDVGAVTFNIEGSAYPNDIGTAEEWLVRIDPNQLTLRTPPERARETDVACDLVWERER
jgi:hypothetical protein